MAITFKSGVDDPHRFPRSKSVGAHFGMTPRKYQSGETKVTGGISKVGDVAVHTALYQGAHIILSKATPYSSLEVWAVQVANRRGLQRANLACARKLAIILHRMRFEETDFRWRKETTAAVYTNGRRSSRQDANLLSCPCPAAGTKEPVKAVCPIVTAHVAKSRA